MEVGGWIAGLRLTGFWGCWGSARCGYPGCEEEAMYLEDRDSIREGLMKETSVLIGGGSWRAVSSSISSFVAMGTKNDR
jgi:hypothetical protein